MNKVRNNAGLEVRAAYAAYLARRLHVAGQTDLETEVLAVHGVYKAAVGAVDEVEWTVTVAVADRDIADDALDLTARTFFAALGGRSADAKQRGPYPLICPEGIPHYVDADLGEQVGRYGLLATRIEANLASDDLLRATAADVRARLEIWKAAAQGVADTRNALQLARDARNAARTAWDAEVVKVWGTLVAQVGEKAAAKYFPRREKVVEAAPVEPAPVATPPAVAPVSGE